MSIAKRLEDLDADWKATGTNGSNEKSEYEPVPDGTYQARVKSFDIFEGKHDGDVTLRTEFEIITGDRSGRSVSTFHNLENPDRLPYAKSHLAMLGIELEKLSEIQDKLDPALDSVCEIAVKSKEGTSRSGERRTYTNVYLNKVLADVKAGGSEPKSEPVVADDIPF